MKTTVVAVSRLRVTVINFKKMFFFLMDSCKFDREDNVFDRCNSILSGHHDRCIQVALRLL